MIEEKNIESRIKEFEMLINEETTNVYKRIFGVNDHNDDIFKFSYNEKKMKGYLSYVDKWKGLRLSEKIPLTKNEYQNKSRNWLNGRRSKQYGNDLYYDMITQAIEV